MRIFNTEVPTYAVVMVIVSAALLGLSLSLLLCYCYRKQQNTPIRKLSRDKNKGVKKVTNRGPRRSPSPTDTSLDKVNIRKISPPTLLAVQPKKSEMLPSVTSSTVSDISEREERLAARFKEGKVARIKLAVCYHEKALWFAVVDIRSMHSSVNVQNARVELRKERGEEKEKLISVAVIPKGGRLRGRPETRYKFPMNLEDIAMSTFNFYLWSTSLHSRYYQAGVCEVKFNDSHLQNFTNNDSCEIKADFKVTEEEDATGCASISLALRYINRTGKLEVTIASLANIPKSGWRSHIPSLSDHLEPSPVVKVTMSHDEGRFKNETHSTEPIRGYNVTIDREFKFDVPLSEVQLPGNVKLTVHVSHTNFKLNHNAIGTLEFSGQSTGKAGEHWREMIQMISVGCKGPLKTHYLRNRNKM